MTRAAPARSSRRRSREAWWRAAGTRSSRACFRPRPWRCWRSTSAAVISASHNPPEYNGVKLFDREGQKLTDADEEEIEALFDAPAADTPGSIDRVGVATDSYLEHITERFGSDLSGLRLVVDCANGAYSGIAPHAFEQLGAEVTAIGSAPDGTNINVGCGATDLGTLQQTVTKSGADLGIAFDGDGDRMLAVDARGQVVDGDQIIAILMLHLEVDLVAVTSMTNIGLHRLAAEHGIRVVTTDVGDRYVLEALRREGGVLGGEQSGHIIYLRDHVTGDGLAAGTAPLRRARGPHARGGRGRARAFSAGDRKRASCREDPPGKRLGRDRAPERGARRRRAVFSCAHRARSP